MKQIFPFIAILLLVSGIHAQESTCGTHFSDTEMHHLRTVLKKIPVSQHKDGEVDCVPIRYHIVRSDDGVSAATQAVFEYCVLNIAAWTKIRTFSPNLALAGGGALNRNAVDLLRDKWDTVHVPKNPGDPGSCIGAVLAKTKTKVTIDKQWHR